MQVLKILKILENDYLLGFDKAKNEPRQVCCLIRAREPQFQIVSVAQPAAQLAPEDGCERFIDPICFYVTKGLRSATYCQISF